jgi:hypothetical protein
MITGRGAQVPSRYAYDPRVTVRDAGGFTVTDDEGTVHFVIYSDEYRWTVCLAPSTQPMPTANGYHARYYNNAAVAICRIIGNPITTAVAA